MQLNYRENTQTALQKLTDSMAHLFDYGIRWANSIFYHIPNLPPP